MMVTAGLLYLALFALAAHMQRHRPALLGPWQKHPRIRHLAMAGWLLLGLSLLSLGRSPDAGMALVAWVGLLALLGGGVMLGMTYRPVVPRVGVPVAMMLILLGLIAPG
ncbi:DUF3325 family protein [Sphingobium sp. HBC34]|uniref:DUF3325 family protein n=1 Tax=Sphingobium cyanobacteriorum TaxID=3063954 RepID=A0ABT8ZLS0_9SPHN|nr:DUF3325 family protein [Sphingobium sp. HBC34]MDO7835475.1 DUF3325 family protein [Sphingobium sp. HBC34]